IVLGLVFILIVMVLPDGVAGLVVRALCRARYQQPAPAKDDGVLLAVDAVSKSFGGLRAVDEVSLTAARGEILGIIGPNGSGKTTLPNLPSGALQPSSGTIRFAGTVINPLPAHRIARLGLARTFQLVRVLPHLTARENVAAAMLFRGTSTAGD